MGIFRKIHKSALALVGSITMCIVVLAATAAFAGSGTRTVSARGPAPIGGYNGNPQWTDTWLKTWGVCWGDGSGITTYLYLNWHTSGYDVNREIAECIGSTGVNYFTYTSEPSYAVLTVCAYNESGEWTCGPEA